ncbi:hypothetical protein Tco_0209384 [Tanacetum coccineum]
MLDVSAIASRSIQEREIGLVYPGCFVGVKMEEKDIYPRVEGEEFTKVQDDDATLTFLADLGYKESYQMFLKYTTCQIPPKKSRGKGSHGKKIVDTHVADVEVFGESDSKPARKRTASRRVVKKKITISTADNIIPDPDVALEIGKSISSTEAAKKEAARSTRGVVIQDPSSVPKLKPANSKLKIKGVQPLTPEEHEYADIMQALKEIKKTSRRLPGTGGSSEGTGVSPGVLDKSTVIPTTLNSDEDEEKKDDIEDDKSNDLEMTDDEETDDEFVHGVEQVNDDEDEEMTNAEVKESGNDDEENTDAAKTDAGKTKEVKDDAKKAKLPPTSSSLSISSGFGDHFLKPSSDTSLVIIVKDTTNVEINSLLDIKIQSKVLHIQSPFVLTIPVSVIFELVVLTPILITPSVAPETTLLTPSSVFTIPPIPYKTTAPIPAQPIITKSSTITIAASESNALFVVQLRVAKLEKDRHTADIIQKYFVKPALESSKIQTPTINLEQEFEKSTSEILKIKKEMAEKQKMPRYTIKSTDKASLKEYDQKSALYQTMHENKSFNRNPANHRLYHALMKALIEDENAMDKGVANISESSKKPSTTKEAPKGKAPSKGSKTGKSASAKEPVEEPNAEVVMDDAVNTAGEDVNGSSNLQGLLLLIRIGTSVKLYLVNLNSLGPAYNLLKGTCSSSIKLEYNFQECFNALTDKLDWNNPEGDRYTFDLSKPLPFVKNFSVKKLHGNGHLEEVVVKRVDRQLYKLKEGDFVDLYLNDIEDMLILAFQHKLFHLNDSDIIDFIVALCMFTRSLVIKRQVEDLQLGVESYQKKLNITTPQQTFPEIKFKELYTPSYKPPGVIYEDLSKQK